MSRKISKLASDQDLAEFARLTVNAYPGMATDAEGLAKRLQERKDRDDSSGLWGFN
ncbi:MAG: hypothetical protein AB1445_15165 [Bacillota bacterium]